MLSLLLCFAACPPIPPPPTCWTFWPTLDPDPDAAYRDFPGLADCEEALSILDVEIMDDDDRLNLACVDPSCWDEWEAYWTARRDAAEDRRACWQILRHAQWEMSPIYFLPIGPDSLASYAAHPADAETWGKWRAAARVDLCELRKQIGREAYDAKRMPLP